MFFFVFMTNLPSFMVGYCAPKPAFDRISKMAVTVMDSKKLVDTSWLMGKSKSVIANTNTNGNTYL